MCGTSAVRIPPLEGARVQQHRRFGANSAVQPAAECGERLHRSLAAAGLTSHPRRAAPVRPMGTIRSDRG